MNKRNFRRPCRSFLKEGIVREVSSQNVGNPINPKDAGQEMSVAGHSSYTTSTLSSLCPEVNIHCVCIVAPLAPPLIEPGTAGGCRRIFYPLITCLANTAQCIPPSQVHWTLVSMPVHNHSMSGMVMVMVVLTRLVVRMEQLFDFKRFPFELGWESWWWLIEM